MGFFQDLKQDLSQTVNGLEPEDAVAELNLEEAEAAASQRSEERRVGKECRV